jgi:hypothetical protein
MTGIPVEQLDLQLARLYLRAGGVSVGLEALRTYHSVADPPAYTEAAYLDIFPVLDEESEVIARGVQSVFASRSVQETDDEEAGTAVESLHDRSTNLSDLVEQMSVPPLLDPAHRYRVLAYNMLNQSNFEALLFLRTGDAERRRRADLLRKAFRRARAQAVQLGEELLEPEAEA